MSKNKQSLKREERKDRFSLTILFALIIFVILIISILLTALIVYILSKLDVMSLNDLNEIKATPLFLLLGSISIVIGFGISIIAMKLPLKPFNQLINMMNRLSSGDFKVRLKLSKPYSQIPALMESCESINKMASELESTQMLRSDFINNFSHEFKTPIVSISGFAKLLKYGNLSEKEKIEYINIIEEESARLTYIANNVLSMTRIDNKTILTDISIFNLSEQLRSCFLLLENKWSAKDIELSLDFEEFEIEGNEELLKEVWINILDNAVKFTPQNGRIKVDIKANYSDIEIKIANSGSRIAEENLSKIFNKFYQCDESHSGMGNGLGLAIASKIINLHNGKIYAESNSEYTTFTVILPK